MTNRYFLGGFLMPHPPIIVPDVGNGRENDAQATLHGMNTLAELRRRVPSADPLPW